MKRKYMITMTIGLLLCGMTVTPHAALVNIGTATYNGTFYNLIYHADAPLGPITWLDYTNHSINSWTNMN